jgi:hypothetical protein
VSSNLDFDKRRKKEKEKKEEKKIGNSKSKHFPKEMTEAKRYRTPFMRSIINVYTQRWIKHLVVRDGNLMKNMFLLLLLFYNYA